jgi:hypothetical protein
VADSTTYIVLRRILVNEDADEAWETTFTDGVDARDANDAIRKVAADDFGHLKDEKPGAYVAVPARSWKPVQVRTETTTTIRLDTPPAE